MKFIDEVTFHVKAGDGGAGCVSFYRGAGIPNGGPDGGDGGNGGSVYFYADESVSTLLDLRFTRKVAAKNGQQGMGADCNGRGGEDSRLRVPVGTLIWNSDTGELMADLNEVGKSVKIARGGRGGLGNMNFATATRQAPRFAQPGTAGEEFNIRLELRLLADVGIIGFPNVGKSTLISRISAAKPKIADYPFTTLVPNLGVVRVDTGKSFVVADIPGLIPGASAGAGLGIQFLRHVSRVSLFVHVVAFDWSEGRDPVADYKAIRDELGAYDQSMLEKPEIIVLNKTDLGDSDKHVAALKKLAAKEGRQVFAISAVSGTGVKELISAIAKMVRPGAKVDVDEYLTRGAEAKTQPASERAEIAPNEDRELSDAEMNDSNGETAVRAAQSKKATPSGKAGTMSAQAAQPAPMVAQAGTKTAAPAAKTAKTGATKPAAASTKAGATKAAPAAKSAKASAKRAAPAAKSAKASAKKAAPAAKSAKASAKKAAPAAKSAKAKQAKGKK